MSWGRHTHTSEYLPPREAWLFDPYSKKHRVPSEVDERGIVVPDATNASVLSMLDPSYNGIKDMNLNHYVFDELKYKGKFIGSLSLVKYRNLVPLTRYLPEDVHNFFTLVVEEPPMPEPEVMSYAIEAWQVTLNLFKKAADIREVEKQALKRALDVERNPGLLAAHATAEDRIGQEYLMDEYNRRFSGLESRLVSYDGLPSEFKPAQLDVDQEPRELVQNIVTTLGSYVTPQKVRPPTFARAA